MSDEKRISVKPLPRHAELAVNMAGSLASFLLATFEAKRWRVGERTMAAKIPIERVGEIMKIVLTELKNAGGEAKLSSAVRHFGMVVSVHAGV